jgi:hypothetical protein
MDTDILFLLYGTAIFIIAYFAGWQCHSVYEANRRRREADAWRESIKYETLYGRNRERK